jgi:hypothetical protein
MPSCRCQDFPFAVAPVCDAARDRNYAGVAVFGHFFEAPDLDTFEPVVTFGGLTTRCTSCGQAWYIELEPEPSPIIAFAMKLDEMRQPGKGELKSAQAFLLVLAHLGFSSERCRKQGCENPTLRGRALCQLHWSFPAYS